VRVKTNTASPTQTGEGFDSSLIYTGLEEVSGANVAELPQAASTIDKARTRLIKIPLRIFLSSKEIIQQH
jgi:hypothetical protein